MVDGAYLSIQRSGEPQSRGPRNWLNRPSGEKLVKRNPIVEVRLGKLHVFERTNKGPSRGVQEIAQNVARDCLAFSTELYRW
ncbi:hypothetical protein BELL_0808g00040 [Botrytis elliptica]|uniref:Uncharacterized protein n=1 Tax=Botrytis elliptica TaxID=278938 RepID=A0A4Z1J5E4_9HELO|nr:hypothetical protein BELL_0808g00040 [Botrytis elliptica]